MKKSIMAVLALAAAVVHAENVVYGVGALAESSNTVGAVAIGREALGSADGASDSVAVGNYAALGAKNCGTTIAIGKGALVGVENVNRTVAIGAYEMFGESGQDDTTSINSKQLWVSKPLDAFCINPAKSLHITNTPLYYIGGEIHMNADTIRMSSKSSLLTGKKIKTGETDIEIPLHTVLTNSISDGSVHIYVITNCKFSALCYPEGNDYEIDALYLSVYAKAYNLGRNYANGQVTEELIPLYDGQEISSHHVFYNIPLMPGASAAYGNDSLSIRDDYTADTRIRFSDSYGETFTSNIDVAIPLSVLLEKQTWDPILHQTPKDGMKTALVSSHGIHDFVDNRLGGMTLAIENGSISVYTNGVKAGSLTFTPTN